MTIAEHMAWAKQRALEFIELQEDAVAAASSLSSDLLKHDEISQMPKLLVQLSKGTDILMGNPGQEAELTLIRGWINETEAYVLANDPDAQWIIEYFAEGRDLASDCHPDFFPTETAARETAPLFMRELPWAVRWNVRPATFKPQGRE